MLFYSLRRQRQMCIRDSINAEYGGIWFLRTMKASKSAHSLGPTHPKGHKPDIGDRWWVYRLAGITKMSNLNIVTHTGLARSFVERWAAVGRSGVQDVSDKPRPGRPHAISPKSQKRLKRALQNRRFVTPARLAPKFGCSARTIARTGRDLIKLRPVKVQYRCRQSAKSLANRVAWAVARKDKPAEYWQRWVWTDEKWFYLVCKKSGEWVWVAEDDLQNECRFVPKDKKPAKIMVWAGISYDGRTSLHMFETDGSIDQHEYQYAMEQALHPAIEDGKYLFPEGQPDGAIFMQDGAPAHKAKTTTKWLATNLPEGWAVNDLSLIHISEPTRPH
eukprot:TRINITY_DN44484_c0_g1_i1.p1 TRINITY_DN44484_c0_g1~~TRINITY_DN44484_c0_g1_i1.p1  ORF type:complete len:332 (+),score=66.97 TRINITY_DN44484_c0_g1_i1:78-1073(+)